MKVYQCRACFVTNQIVTKCDSKKSKIGPEEEVVLKVDFGIFILQSLLLPFVARDNQ